MDDNVKCPEGSVCSVWGGCEPCDRKHHAYRARQRLPKVPPDLQIFDSPFHGEAYDRGVEMGLIKVTELPHRAPAVHGPDWLPKQKPIRTREVVSTPLRGDEPTTLNRWLFGLFVAVVMMGLVSIPLAVITHELAAHGWLEDLSDCSSKQSHSDSDRVGP